MRDAQLAAARNSAAKPFWANNFAENIPPVRRAGHGDAPPRRIPAAEVAKQAGFSVSCQGVRRQSSRRGRGVGAGLAPYKEHMSHRSARVVVAAALVAWPVAVSAQTLQQELKTLVTEHPRIRASSSSVLREGEGVNAAFAGFLPKVALSGDYGREVINSPARRASPDLGVSELPRNKATLSVTQPLFDGLKTPEAVSAAELRKKAAEENLEATKQQTMLDGINAYYGVLRQHKLLAIARENEEVIKRQLQLEDERVQRGAGIAVDVLLAKARLQRAVERRVAVEGALKEAEARYRQVFDHQPRFATMVDPNVDLSFLPANVKAAADIAVAQNPALRESDRRAEAADYQIGVARADYFPRLDVVGQVNREENIDAARGLRKDWSVLLRVTWELFSGFATNAAYNAAIYEKATAQDTYLDRRRQVVQELEIAWEALATARERMRLLDNAVSIAEEVFLARGRLRDAGRETAINVLDAQSELFGARLDAVGASYDAQVTAFRVLAAMGALTPENLKMD